MALDAAATADTLYRALSDASFYGNVTFIRHSADFFEILVVDRDGDGVRFRVDPLSGDEAE